MTVSEQARHAGQTLGGEDGSRILQDPPAQPWTHVITARRSLFSLSLSELWNYRDLLMLLVYRDFVAMYKQTILGPLWFIIQPLLTALVFTIVFGNIAKISTDGLPQIVFYLAGVTCWTYFAETLTKTSETFTSNAHIFGKVYFPRMIIPLSIVVSNLMKFAVQFAIFLGIAGWFWWSGANVAPNAAAFLLPVIVATMGVLGLGLGMIVASMTTKYRDLRFLLAFGVQLMMYATPVIYPLSAVSKHYRWLIVTNPVTSLVECFRYGFLGAGIFEPLHLLYSIAVSIALLALAMVIFNQIEKTFMDTV
jgi:lipopolysaccharide transport system permease protein